MDEYYILVGTERQGPYTVEQLQEKKVSPETLVWKQGMNEWSRAKHTKGLKGLLTRSEPPPTPKKELAKGFFRKATRPSVLLVAWSVLHLVLLVCSYNNFENMNRGGYAVEEVWPFANSTDYYEGTGLERHRVSGNPLIEGSAEYEWHRVTETKRRHGGDLYNYDWSEFALYVAPLWALLLMYNNGFFSSID